MIVVRLFFLPSYNRRFSQLRQGRQGLDMPNSKKLSVHCQFYLSTLTYITIIMLSISPTIPPVNSNGNLFLLILKIYPLIEGDITQNLQLTNYRGAAKKRARLRGEKNRITMIT